MIVPGLLFAGAHPLAHTNALLNAAATVLLALGFLLIKRKHEMAHKWVMLSAFGVSVLFLACYLTYHYLVGSVKFQGTGGVRTLYFAILISHIVLAALVPFLAAATIVLGLRIFRQHDPQEEIRLRRLHRQVARWTFPIWLYVSITGVMVYLMLYQLYPA